MRGCLASSFSCNYKMIYSIIYPLYNGVNLINDKTIELIQDFGSEIKQALTEIAKGLGVAAEHVYEVLVRQQVVIGITGILWPILAVIVLLVLSKLFVKYLAVPALKKQIKSEDLAVIILFAAIFLGIGWVVLLINGIISVVESVGHLINPEYYALKEILGFIDQIKNGSMPK